MNVTVDVAGDAVHDVAVGADATYADLVGELDLSPHQVSVLVDGRTVPEDRPVEAEYVEVVRLIRGG